MLILLVGPSGGGKTTILEGLVATGKYAKVRTYTTRMQRDSEADDAYHFVSTSEFTALHKKGFFLEVNEYQGNMYGSSKSSIDDILNQDKTPLMIVDFNGVKFYKGLPDLVAVPVFISAYSTSMLHSRIAKRYPDMKGAFSFSSRNPAIEAKRQEYKLRKVEASREHRHVTKFLYTVLTDEDVDFSIRKADALITVIKTVNQQLDNKLNGDSDNGRTQPTRQKKSCSGCSCKKGHQENSTKE